MMTERNLIVNPYLNLRFIKNEKQNDCLWFSSPTKNAGVQILEFERDTRREIYDLFLELNQTSLNFLDIEEDLSIADRDFLISNGVLVSPNKISQPPLFACFLDDIEIDNSISLASDLIVNESFYYDEAHSYEAIIERRKYGFEPQTPVVWVTDPKTEITFGYWLRNDFVEVTRNFKAGERPLNLLTERQSAILRQADILVSPDSLNQTKWAEQLIASTAQFQKEKYTSLREILPPVQLAAIRCYFEKLRAEGFMLFNDSQVSLRHAIHNDALSIYFHQQLAPLISRTVGEKVKPSYVYSATYVEDAVLKAHTDRPQCEFTVSMQIGYEPEQPNGVSPWALCLDDLRENRIETFLANGDALIYKGCELVHYREALFKKHQSTSIFFHYVPENFDGPLD